MEQNQFDRQIKEALENLEVPFDASHWMQMEQQMDNISVMEDITAFDSLISGKLENIETNAAIPNWQRMSAALDQAEVNDKNFDTEVKTKINFINPTYQPSHWEILGCFLSSKGNDQRGIYNSRNSC